MNLTKMVSVFTQDDHKKNVTSGEDRNPITLENDAEKNVEQYVQELLNSSKLVTQSNNTQRWRYVFI